MNREQLQEQIESLVRGDISAEDHGRLAQRLKADAEARVIFREQMDVEAGLRTWAAELLGEPDNQPEQKTARLKNANQPATGARRRSSVAWIVLGAAAAILLPFAVWAWTAYFHSASDQSIVEDSPPGDQTRSALSFLGLVREQPTCTWTALPSLSAGRFAGGRFALSSGVAELVLHSGTHLVLEAPCEVVVTSADAARLLKGNVCINVTELSDGFTLQTPDAEIIDEGTEYAVALDDATTEVHVFDGSVIWIPQQDAAAREDRIEAGEARRFLRDQPAQPQRIPFGQRQFVRQLEAELKQQAGDSLLAYDGFENLAGRIRRDRSGFGWSGGWQGGRFVRGQLATIVDAPDEVVFGLDRSGRRLLSLSDGDDIRRNLEQPFDFDAGTTYFVSLLIQRQPATANEKQSLQISLEPTLAPRNRRGPQNQAFGVTSFGFPFVKSASAITETASRVSEGETCLCVVKLVSSRRGVTPFLRIYRPGESVDVVEPLVWTVTGECSGDAIGVAAIRVAVGELATWQIDELKIGTTWEAVTTASTAKH